MKSIKKTLCSLLTILLLLSAITPVMASGDIKVKIDGKQIEFDVPPQIIKDRTMVPLRAIFEALGATVDWDSHTRTVNSTKNGIRISLTVNYPRMDVNGKDVMLDSAPRIVDGRTLVPVRAISEAFGTKVEWISSEKTVVISTTGTTAASSDNTKTEINEAGKNQSDNTLVYEDSKVKINFLRVEKSKYGENKVKVFCDVKNKTNEPLKIQCDALSLNGYCFNYVIMSDDVSAGSVATVDTTLEHFDFSLVDINNITSFGGQFRIISANKNFDTYDATFMNKNLHTNKIEKSYPAVRGKELLYSDNRINVYFDYAENDDEDFEVYLTVQNKTDETIRIQNETVVINGRSYDNTIMSDDILAYTTGNVNVTVKDSAMSSSVSTVGGEFRIISGSDSFETYSAVLGNGASSVNNSYADEDDSDDYVNNTIGTESAATGAKRLVEYIVANGKTEKGYKQIQSNRNNVISTITYRNDSGLLIFHSDMDANGSQVTVSFDYDIESEKAASKISFGFFPSQPGFFTGTAPFNISSYTADAGLSFQFDKSALTALGISMDDAACANLANSSVKLAAAAWQHLMFSEAGLTLQDIGFSSY